MNAVALLQLEQELHTISLQLVELICAISQLQASRQGHEASSFVANSCLKPDMWVNAAVQ